MIVSSEYSSCELLRTRPLLFWQTNQMDDSLMRCVLKNIAYRDQDMVSMYFSEECGHPENGFDYDIVVKTDPDFISERDILAVKLYKHVIVMYNDNSDVTAMMSQVDSWCSKLSRKIGTEGYTVHLLHYNQKDLLEELLKKNNYEWN
jgi:hypothetical protein